MNINAYNEIQIEALKLAVRKNADYSGSKIDNLAITGVNGISVRLLDKVSRVYNLSSGAESQVKTESMRDTLVDIINYATFAVMMVDDEWNKSSSEDGHVEDTISRIQQSRNFGNDIKPNINNRQSRTIGDNNG